ncbi:MAG: glutamate-5-semialdehyde dehydrogenase [Anaerolineae bacterium]|jgi:glutamate-5-semialdehyde dehydrogenase|nr:glutamate-5-semialdehyde dehydrogenase [Chloroflexota bacterium]
MEDDIRQLAQKARTAGHALSLIPAEARKAALLETARRLEEIGEPLWAANRKDLETAAALGISPAMLDRATLNPGRLASMVNGLRSVAALTDPVGETFDGATLPNGLRVVRKRVPLGVLAVIFESRPNVTTEISALGIKTGNSVILRGGRESLETNKVLVGLVRAACAESGLPEDTVQLITSTDRALVPQLLRMDDLIDLVIPRGGQQLQNLVKEHARMPVVYGGIGVCHLFVDSSADLARSIPVIVNAKVQAPSVCNALDTVLVHREVVAELVPAMVRALNEQGVQVLCDPESMSAAVNAGLQNELLAPAGEGDFGREFLSLVVSVKVVGDLEEAIQHIAQYSTHHSDGILTESYTNANRFLDMVDSAVVYVNASTRFTDGGQLGLGAEVAISTQRMHARGPMGLRELTTYKWVVQGDYHVRR